jgi:hypothetical protein
VLTILANRVAPSLLDRFLAKTNVEGQQSPDHDPPARQANTWQPVYGAEVKAHGSFDEQAYAHSPELWVSQHRAVVAATLAGGAGLLARRLSGRPSRT